MVCMFGKPHADAPPRPHACPNGLIGAIAVASGVPPIVNWSNTTSPLSSVTMTRLPTRRMRSLGTSLPSICAVISSPLPVTVTVLPLSSVVTVHVELTFTVGWAARAKIAARGARSAFGAAGGSGVAGAALCP